MHIHYSYKAETQLTSLDVQTQRRIARKMRFFSEQADPLMFATYISYRAEYRFRIGDYRIFFEVRGRMLIVHTIERRDSAYL